jgi:hypothetical protein
MFPEVIPLPAVEIGAKAIHEPYPTRRESLFREGMDSVGDGQGLLVKGAAIFPRGFPEGPEVRVPQVFHEDETRGGVVADQPGRWNTVLPQKVGDFGIISVFYPLRVVTDQDSRILSVELNPEESPVRPSPLEGRKIHRDGLRKPQGFPAETNHPFP